MSFPDRNPDFDRNFAGPSELKPRVYRTQTEKDIWHSIGVENEYKLPVLGADDVVIDIGAHIGAFSHLAYRMGSRTIYAFEIDPWHFEAAHANLRDMREGVQICNMAVVRGDERRAAQYHYNGAWNSFGVVGPVVPSISLNEILEPHEQVRFLKIDVEGCEWGILYTCTQLAKVQEIAGEWHKAIPDVDELKDLPYPMSPEGLAQFLFAQGFEVKWTTQGMIGNFSAKRR